MNCNTINQERAARKQVFDHVTKVLGHRRNGLKLAKAIEIFANHYSLKINGTNRAWLYELYLSGSNKYIKKGAKVAEKEIIVTKKIEKKVSYSSQLKSKEWRAKRKEILKRDKNECQMCMRKTQLHVHHKKYIKGKNAWEYEDNYLITVCEDCHSKHHGIVKTLSIAPTEL